MCYIQYQTKYFAVAGWNYPDTYSKISRHICLHDYTSKTTKQQILVSLSMRLLNILSFYLSFIYKNFLNQVSELMHFRGEKSLYVGNGSQYNMDRLIFNLEPYKTSHERVSMQNKNLKRLLSFSNKIFLQSLGYHVNSTTV